MPELITALIIVSCLFLIFVEIVKNKLRTTEAHPNEEQISDKTRLVTLLLCVPFGSLGMHRFYVGKTGTAILMILTFGGFGFWTLLDTLFVIIGRFTDVNRKQVFRWTENG
jgi:TM2 domain-containing membrane protein YozV